MPNDGPLAPHLVPVTAVRYESDDGRFFLYRIATGEWVLFDFQTCDAYEFASPEEAEASIREATAAGYEGE